MESSIQTDKQTELTDKIQFRCTAELYEAVRIHAAVTRSSMQEICTRAVQQFLDGVERAR